MATFELKNQTEYDKDHTQCVIVVSFDNPEYVPERTETIKNSVVKVDGNDEPILDENGDYQYEEKEIEHTFEAEGEPQLIFEQDVILPTSGTDKAAQAYADDYEKQYNLTLERQ